MRSAAGDLDNLTAGEGAADERRLREEVKRDRVCLCDVLARPTCAGLTVLGRAERIDLAVLADEQRKVAAGRAADDVEVLAALDAGEAGEAELGLRGQAELAMLVVAGGIERAVVRNEQRKAPADDGAREARLGVWMAEPGRRQVARTRLGHVALLGPAAAAGRRAQVRRLVPAKEPGPASPVEADEVRGRWPAVDRDDGDVGEGAQDVGAREVLGALVGCLAGLGRAAADKRPARGGGQDNSMSARRDYRCKDGGWVAMGDR